MTDLKVEIEKAIESSPDGWSEGLFDDLALRSFHLQYHNIGPYRKLCDARGKNPENVKNWWEIPHVPVGAFKQFRMFVGEEGEVKKEFKTSGTSGSQQGVALFGQAGLELMESCIIFNARRMLFPDGGRYLILVLAPPPDVAVHMIMAYGMRILVREWGEDGSRFLLGQGGLDIDSLTSTLKKAEEEGTPVTLIGASFAFVNLADRYFSLGESFKLPPGSRLMDAGGYKGKSREVSRGDFPDLVEKTFGIPGTYTVNLLGMTELASQFYDANLYLHRQGEIARRIKWNAPWTRTRALDPETLETLQPGETGVLAHIDIANMERPSFILTDDLGYVDNDGFEVIGRAADDRSRGCSVTVDEMM